MFDFLLKWWAMLVYTINTLLGRNRRGPYVPPPPIVVDPPPVGLDPAQGVSLFTETFENADTVPTWVDQPIHFGHEWVPGEVPLGNIVMAVVDGAFIPCQLSERTYWNDGSLKFAQVSAQVPTIAVGGNKTVTWKRYESTWAANDAALHSHITAVDNNINLEYAFTSWKGRNTSNVLTEERGPKTFSSAVMLDSANANWIEPIGHGKVCSEWRVTDFARKADNSVDPNFGAMLYVRAWGGTPGFPKYIEFLFRTMYGWSDNTIPVDEQGYMVDMDLKINGSAIRGTSLGTTGWTQRHGFKGGFFASPGPTGKMDMYDVELGAFVTPPKLVLRRNMAHAIQSKFLPPYDLTNPLYSAAGVLTYTPQTRAGLTFDQGDTGDNGNIPWATNTVFARSAIAHSRRPVAEIVSQDQNTRVTAFGLAAEGALGFNKSTRKIICHLPPERNPDPVALGASIWDGTKPQHLSTANRSLNSYMTGQDGAHWPQIAYPAYFMDGEQHLLDLVYHEAAAVGMFSTDAYGFRGTFRGVRYGGLSFYGQIRMAGQGVRPVVNAVGIGNPTDPHWKLCNALLDNWLELDAKVAENEDAWRGSTTQQLYGVYRMNNEPTYKLWMHSFALYALSMGYGITEKASVKARADWWSKLFVIAGGGYKNDSDYLLKPDPSQINAYFSVCTLLGGGTVTADRRVWHPGQWKYPEGCVYSATDNQTVTFDVTNIFDGMIITPAGLFGTSGDPPFVADITKVPNGLNRGKPYYAVQSSGKTCKLALTPGGDAVTFDVAGVDLRGSAAAASVNGVTPITPIGASVCPTPIHFFNQNKGALDVYQHYCAPSDPRVLLARQQLKAYKDADPNNSGYDVKAKFTVPH